MTEGPDFPALRGRRSGVLRISADRAVFVADEAGEPSLALSLDRLAVSVEGENSPHYFLTDPENPDDAICVQDLAAVRALADRGVSSAKRALASAGGRAKKRAASVGSTFLLPVVLIVGIPLLLSFLPVAWLNGTLSHRQERRIGRALLSAMVATERTEAAAARRGLEAIVEFLRAANPALAETEFEVHLSPDSAVNAFALPGGIIVFNQGFLSQAKSLEEVAGVLAHEMGHVERRHTLKAMAGRVGAMVGYVVVVAVAGTGAAEAIGKAENLFSLKYSRAAEAEADARALDFLRNAKVSAEGMIAFFTRVSTGQEAGGSMGSVLSLLSTHPLSAERIAAIRAGVDASPYEATARFPAETGALGIGK